MEHTINTETLVNTSITIKEREDYVELEIRKNHNEEFAILTAKELHSFIGTLLHVQAKLKK